MVPSSSLENRSSLLERSNRIKSKLKSMGSPMDDGPSEAASSLPWLWVIEALAGCKEIQTSTLQDLIDVAPVMLDDFCKKTRESLAMRCLEGLFGFAHRIGCEDASTSLDSRVGFDFSLDCEDVLQQILNEISLSNLKMAGSELLKWDVFPFIMHKRASIVKSDLEQLKESIFEGTHPYTDYFKERSGLALQNGVYPVHVNDGECNDLSEEDDENCTYGANMEAKENLVSVFLENGNKSSKKYLLDENFLPSKRNRVDSADEHVIGYQHGKQLGINECEDFLIYAKKIKCNESSNIESKKEKPLSPHGKGVIEDSTGKFLLISETGACHTEKDIRENVGECSLKGSHDRCIVSNWCRSSGHDKVFHGESNIPFDATVMHQHTSGGEYCQQKEVESAPTKVPLPDEIQHKFPENCLGMSTTMVPPYTSGDEPCQNTSSDGTKYDTEHCIEPIPTNVDDPHKAPNTINGSHSKWKIDFQLNKPNAASLNVSQQPVTSDKAVDDTVNGYGAEISSDSDGYHNETIDLAAKKHEFLSSQCKFGHDFLASTEQTENNLCMKCNEVGELLVCNTTTCPLMVHKSCLATSAQVDAESNFFCPFCAYCHAISEYLEAKKKASLARKELAIFICKDIGHQNTKLLYEVHRKEHGFSRKSSKYKHFHDKNIGNDLLPGTEDNREDHVGEHEVNSLRTERSQQQALTSGINSSCREKEIVNNGKSGEEVGEMLKLKSSTSRGVEEIQVSAEHGDGDGNFSCEKANFLSVNQSNTEEIQQEMLEQYNTVRTEELAYAHDSEEEEISKDEYETPIISRYAMRFRKR